MALIRTKYEIHTAGLDTQKVACKHYDRVVPVDIRCSSQHTVLLLSPPRVCYPLLFNAASNHEFSDRRPVIIYLVPVSHSHKRDACGAQT